MRPPPRRSAHASQAPTAGVHDGWAQAMEAEEYAEGGLPQPRAVGSRLCPSLRTSPLGRQFVCLCNYRATTHKILMGKYMHDFAIQDFELYADLCCCKLLLEHPLA